MVQTQHTFKHVFDEDSIQTDLFDSLGFPFVEDLLQGKDGTSYCMMVIDFSPVFVQ